MLFRGLGRLQQTLDVLEENTDRLIVLGHFAGQGGVARGFSSWPGRDNVPSTWPAIRLQSDRIHAAVRDSVGTPISFTGKELFFF